MVSAGTGEDAADEAYLAYLDEEENQQTGTVRVKPHPRDLPRRNPAEVAEEVSQEAGWKTTYKPSRHEAGWLVSSLGPFFEQDLLSDVLYLVKGGKEANVYCCAAHPALASAMGAELLAAKVYRPRQFRNLRNDRLYREGRPVLTEDGRAVKPTDTRIMRALGKKTDFGVQVQHTSWLQYEFTTLQKLYENGVSVPRPVAAGENAVLMDFCGDRDSAAPTLSEVGLQPDDARRLWPQVREALESLLKAGLVHGDLSAYNILYWKNRAVLIDLPQVVAVDSNPHAHDIFVRDVTRVCQYFARLGVDCDAESLAQQLWRRYGREAN